MANGQLITRKRGTAHFRYGEAQGGADVVFGEPGDANLVGVTTLEALDPFRRELRPMPMLLGSAGQADEQTTVRPYKSSGSSRSSRS
jgi:hypothetical protein